MAKNLYTRILSYFNEIMLAYQAIAQLNSALSPLKLISINSDKTTNKLYFIIQLTGKNIFSKLDIETIKNESIFLNFSENDKEIIRFFCSNSIRSNKYISAVTFDRMSKQCMYDLKNQDMDNTLVARLTSKQLKNLLRIAPSAIKGDTAYVYHLESCYH